MPELTAKPVRPAPEASETPKHRSKMPQLVPRRPKRPPRLPNRPPRGIHGGPPEAKIIVLSIVPYLGSA
eukprot:3433022-Pyramimonas_sp.AAC.1